MSMRRVWRKRWQELWENEKFKTTVLFVPAGVVAIVLVIGFFGKEEPLPLLPGVHVTETGESLTHLLPTAVIVAINGEALTRHEFDMTLSMYAKIFRLQRPSLYQWQADRMAQAREGRVIADFIHSALFRQEAQRRGITPDAEILAEVSARTLDSLRREEGTLEAVAEEIGGEEGDLFYKSIIGSARDRTLFRVVGGDSLVVTDEDIDAAEEKAMAECNARDGAADTDEAMEIPSREALRERLVRERMAEVSGQLVRRLYDEAVVEYPHGTNLFSRAAPPRTQGTPRR